MRALLLLPLLLFFACKKDRAGCFDSRGKETVAVRTLQGIRGIDINDKFDLKLIYDSTSPTVITISTGQNLVTGIRTEINDSILYIRNENKCNFVRDLTERIPIEIRLNNLDYLVLREAAKITCTDTMRLSSLFIMSNSLEDVNLVLRSEFIDVRAYNSGAVNLTGKAQLIAATIEDVCVFNCMNMDVNDCYIFHYGRKDAFIDGKKIIGAFIYNSSNVYYRTIPDIEIFAKRTGTGNLIKK